ncbi:hypothetical protein OOZ19_17550 [Saccharopolyspora sp. NFXS83]|uniref:hypothetical protein n=1 Tax=Saccharopolyspora sp. NFXS83 TaxID=2993560 RepID=UPI00224AD1DE|nr:hypothetical protein [Saccharopolyspora sp. NFXS83]MCX2732047.1 hypothetical protein [Saccharopolyspora sp. NFXS83]
MIRVEVRAATRSEHAVSGTVRVDPAEPVFAGHYPGFPLLPGLALLDVVQAVVRSCPGREFARLDGVERVRFFHEVRPGDELAVEVEFGADGGCAVAIGGEQGRVAQLRCGLRVPAVAA